MDEKIKARYIDPMVDWSFKRLFGSEVNKDILIEFLKVIFPEHEIEDITYIPAEQLGIMEDDRKAVFDVICRTKNGEEFIVEMQCATQKHFFERALYYTSFPMNQLKKAGVDLSQKSAIEAVAYQLDRLLDSLEEEIKKMEKDI